MDRIIKGGGLYENMNNYNLINFNLTNYKPREVDFMEKTIYPIITCGATLESYFRRILVVDDELKTTFMELFDYIGDFNCVVNCENDKTTIRFIKIIDKILENKKFTEVYFEFTFPYTFKINRLGEFYYLDADFVIRNKYNCNELINKPILDLNPEERFYVDVYKAIQENDINKLAEIYLARNISKSNIIGRVYYYQKTFVPFYTTNCLELIENSDKLKEEFKIDFDKILRYIGVRFGPFRLFRKKDITAQLAYTYNQDNIYLILTSTNSDYSLKVIAEIKERKIKKSNNKKIKLPEEAKGS